MKLFHKLSFGFLIVSFLICITGLFNIQLSKDALEKVIGENSIIIAQETLDKIDRNIYHSIEEMQAYSSDKILQKLILQSHLIFDAMENPLTYIDEKDKEWRAVPKETVTPFMRALINSELFDELKERIEFYERKRNLKVYPEVFVTNKYGVNVGQTGKTSDYFQADEEWWQRAKHDGLYIGNVKYDDSSNSYSIDIGLRIEDENGNFMGVIKALLNIEDSIKILHELVKVIQTKSTEINGYGHDHAHYNKLDIKLISQEGKLLYSSIPDYEPMEDISQELLLYIKHEKSTASTFAGRDMKNKRNKLIAHAHSHGYSDYRGLGWILILELDKDEVFSPIDKLNNYILALSLAVTLCGLMIGFLISRSITKAVGKLRNASKQLGKGNLNIMVDVDSKDEIGELARTFNHMTDELRKVTSSRDELNKEINNRKQAEKKLDDSELRFQSVIESAHDIIVSINNSGKIIFWNKAAENIFGYSDKEVSGKSVTMCMPERFRNAHSEGIKHITKTNKAKVLGNTIELVGLRKDGSEFPLELSLSKWTAANQIHYTGIIRDISERKMAESELHKLRRQNELILNSAGEGIYGLDINGNTTFINPSGAKMIGWEPHELIGKSQHDIVHHTRPDGTHYPQNECLIYATFKEGSVNKIDNEVFWRKNGSSFPVEYISTPIRDENDSLIGAVVTFRDITDRKKAEEALMQSHNTILQQEKMASIGQLAAGVAHEINNPTGFISSNLGTLGKYVNRFTEFIEAQTIALESIEGNGFMEELSEKKKKLKIEHISNDVTELINECKDGTDRIKGIVDGLKGFARVDDATRKSIDINQCLDSTLNILNNELKYKCSLNKDYGTLPSTLCYPQQLTQVFVNILVNASHAIENQGEINIKTRNDDKSIFVSISDTGSGIPDDKLRKVFEPFYTTKPVGKGTGLGLSISYDIVKNHGGEMTVESEVGKGTTFNIQLPIEESADV